MSESRFSVETNATTSGAWAGYTVQRVEDDDLWRWEAYGPHGKLAGEAPDRAGAQAEAQGAFRRLAQFGLDG